MYCQKCGRAYKFRLDRLNIHDYFYDKIVLVDVVKKLGKIGTGVMILHGRFLHFIAKSRSILVK